MSEPTEMELRVADSTFSKRLEAFYFRLAASHYREYLPLSRDIVGNCEHRAAVAENALKLQSKAMP